MKNSEIVDEESTASVAPPASLIPPTPLESRMPKTKKHKLRSVAAHLTTGIKELLLLDPP